MNICHIVFPQASCRCRFLQDQSDQLILKPRFRQIWILMCVSLAKPHLHLFDRVRRGYAPVSQESRVSATWEPDCSDQYLLPRHVERGAGLSYLLHLFPDVVDSHVYVAALLASA